MTVKLLFCIIGFSNQPAGVIEMQKIIFFLFLVPTAYLFGELKPFADRATHEEIISFDTQPGNWKKEFDKYCVILPEQDWQKSIFYFWAPFAFESEMGGVISGQGTNVGLQAKHKEQNGVLFYTRLQTNSTTKHQGFL